MFRLFVFFAVFISLIILLIVAYLTYRKIRRGISSAWDKSVEVATEQQQRWKRHEQLKTLPEFMQKAHLQSEQIEQDTESLTQEWQTQLQPLNQAMQHTLNMTVSDPSRAEKVRSFYNTSLPAYAKFVATLKTDHLHLNQSEKQKAMDNISVFKADFQRYDEGVQQARRFDFDVLMDVIKVRLKNR